MLFSSKTLVIYSYFTSITVPELSDGIRNEEKRKHSFVIFNDVHFLWHALTGIERKTLSTATASHKRHFQVPILYLT